MKQIKILFLFLFISNILLAQVIISPYVVYTDEYNKYGSMIVQNESLDPYEISISFIFGYPVSDSLGNRTMKYEQNHNDSLLSIDNWIKAFPRKFILNPKERQTVRMMVKPPMDLKDGTYWTRIVTSSTPVEKLVDSTQNGVSARVKFVLNQVTTALFRKGKNNVNIGLSEPKLVKDSLNNYQFIYSLNKNGNSPFYGNLEFNVYNEKDSLISNQNDYLSLFVNMKRKYVLDKNLLQPGKYKAELIVKYNEKTDIPESKLKPQDDAVREFEFTIK